MSDLRTAKIIVHTGENAMYGWRECGNCSYHLKDEDVWSECPECGVTLTEIQHEPYSFGGSDF